MQLENILYIISTEEVLKLLKSKEVNEIQLLNILPIFVISDVSNFEKSIFIIFDNPLNILKQFVNGEFQLILIVLLFCVKPATFILFSP